MHKKAETKSELDEMIELAKHAQEALGDLQKEYSVDDRIADLAALFFILEKRFDNLSGRIIVLENLLTDASSKELA